MPPNPADLGWDSRAQRFLFACETLANPNATLMAEHAGHAHTARPLTGIGRGRRLSWTAASAATPDPTNTAEAFKLHSRPGARVILLDFDGHTTTGTAWNG